MRVIEPSNSVIHITYPHNGYNDNYLFEKSYSKRCPLSKNLKQGWYVVLETKLTHWERNKMANIFQTAFQMHFLEWKCLNFDHNMTDVSS